MELSLESIEEPSQGGGTLHGPPDFFFLEPCDFQWCVCVCVCVCGSVFGVGLKMLGFDAFHYYNVAALEPRAGR